MNDGFWGRVIAVEFGPGWQPDSLSKGAQAGTRVGPATLRFADGAVLSVPADTPGGNWCRELVDQHILNLNPKTDWDRILGDPCVVFGALDEGGSVDWFSIADRDTSGRFSLPGSLLLHRGMAEFRLGGGYSVTFPLAQEVAVNCPVKEWYTIEEVIDGTHEVDEVIDGMLVRNVMPWPLYAEISLTTGEVITVSCRGVD